MPNHAVMTIHAPPPARALLLDVDGVIVTNPRLTTAISRRATRFVARELSLKMMEADEVNKNLYRTFGHTLTGLKKVYESKRTLEEFDEEVYDPAILEELGRTMRDDPTSDTLRTVVKRARSLSVPTFLFSNAPRAWCETAVRSAGVDDLLLPDENILCCDHPLLDGPRLKPSRALYDATLDFVRATTRHGDDLDLLFVDDSLTNVAPLVKRRGWIPFHFSKTGPAFPGSRAVPTIKSLAHVQPHLLARAAP
jgi:FMN phosphatase YigB (HAD superfamily)